MPSIPRRSPGADEPTVPEEQRTDGDAPTTEPPTQQLSSGDPLANAAAPVPPASTEGASEAPTEIRSGTEASTTTGAPTTSGSVAPGEQPTVAAPALDPLAAPPITPDAPAVAEPAPTALEPEGEQAPLDARPRFRERTRMRRRLRYLRRLRELAFRDLGGLVFDLHRFGRDRADLTAAKLEALAHIDRELRALQDALDDRREFTDLREAGIAACPRCGTLHDTDANFCPGCGTSLRTSVVRDAAPVVVTPAEDAAPPGTQQQSTP